MPRLRYNMATSLDGYIASPDGSSDWIVEDSTINFGALYAEFDYFVMGRKTYEVMLALGGPSDDNPLLKRPKEAIIVASRTMHQQDHPHITIVPKNIIEYIRDLKAGGGKDIWLMGGGDLATQCLEAGLLDSVEAAVMPVVLGGGIKITGEFGKGAARLRLIGSKDLESGIIMTQYDVVGVEDA
ncbi:dihydrofolate reductase-like domain-containing protein [Dactylonectria macrodidyma]|uniref:2,5-diamino-6-ribosylamino-4(3H)-pyrimidinone 5'-phosphate reductase n=1 Tax=Dactylonectria macrodidyma TaxID=307937 RepID=A0A9P9IGW5_9HYPO|nr:dihydrofolate reductase-like domain-containing protein [Dactylonectria macrodidyma]